MNGFPLFFLKDFSIFRNLIYKTVYPLIWLWDVLHGYDLFISYAWADGRSYATSLSNVMQERGYRCFLDDASMPPGGALRSQIKRALKHSSALVAISTERSMQSAEVAQELQAFAPSRRLLVPIFLDSSIRKTATGPLIDLLRQRVWIDEPNQPAVNPSAVVVERLVTTLRFVRRARLRVTAVTMAAMIFAIIAIAALVQLYNVETARQLSAAQVLARTQPTEALLVMREAAGRMFADRSLLPQLNPDLIEANLTYRRHVVGDAVYDVKWLKDGGYAAVSANGHSYIWDNAGKLVDEITSFGTAPIPVSSFIESPDGKFFVTADWQNCLRIFVKGATRSVAQEASTCVNRAPGAARGDPWTLTADGHVITAHNDRLEIVGDASKTVVVPKKSDETVDKVVSDSSSKPYVLLSSKNLLYNFDSPGQEGRLDNVVNVGSCANGRVWAITEDHEFHWFGGAAGKVILTGTQPFKVSDDCLSYVDGLGSIYGLVESQIRLIKAAFAPNWQYSGNAVTVSFSAARHFVAVSSNDGSIKIFDVENNSERFLKGHTQRLFAMAFSPDGHKLLTASYDGFVRIFDLNLSLMVPSGRFKGASTIYRNSETQLPVVTSEAFDPTIDPPNDVMDVATIDKTGTSRKSSVDVDWRYGGNYFLADGDTNFLGVCSISGCPTESVVRDLRFDVLGSGDARVGGYGRYLAVVQQGPASGLSLFDLDRSENTPVLSIAKDRIQSATIDRYGIEIFMLQDEKISAIPFGQSALDKFLDRKVAYCLTAQEREAYFSEWSFIASWYANRCTSKLAL